MSPTGGFWFALRHKQRSKPVGERDDYDVPDSPRASLLEVNLFSEKTSQ